MKRLKAGILGLSLWWYAGPATGDEIAWRPGPVKPAIKEAVTPTFHVPVVTVLRPVALPAAPAGSAREPAILDSRVQRTSFATVGRKLPAVVVRAQKEEGQPKRLPDLFAAGKNDKSPKGGIVPTTFAEEKKEPTLELENIGEPLPIVPTPIDPAAKPLPVFPAAKATDPKAKAGPAFQLATPQGTAAKSADPKALPAKPVDPKGTAAKPEVWQGPLPRPVDPKATAAKPEEWQGPTPKPVNPRTTAAKPEDWQGPTPNPVDSKATAQPDEWQGPTPNPVDSKATAAKPEDWQGPTPKPVTSTPGLEECESTHADGCSSFATDEEDDGLFGLGLGGKAYVNAEYLLWKIRSAAIPALVSTGTPASHGIIGNQGAVPLLGPGSIDQPLQSGARFTVGYWLENGKTVGIEASGFFLGEASRSFTFSSDQFPVLARPFFRLNPPPGEFSEVSTSPGVATGSVTVAQTSQLWGMEANARCNICCGCEYRVDILAGFRYLELKESLSILEDLQATPGGSPFGGDHVVVADSFRTRNQFMGAQVGVDAEWGWGKWFVDFRGKVALGVTHQTIDILGSQTITPPGGSPAVTPGGLLALSSNSGHHSKSQFSVVPEVGINVGYKITDHLRVFAGYNFMYWSGVVRPGDQIDRNLDVNRIMHFLPPQPPIAEARPAVPFKQSDFWAQGVNIGVEFRF